MQVEHRILVAAAPERIFQIYADVAGWSTWDPDTRSASLDGPFRAGTRGRITPAKGRTVPLLLTSVEPGRSFTAEARIPLFLMVFEHVLRPQGPATEVTHRVTFSGLLSLVLGPMLCKQLDAGLPVTLMNLKRLAEAANAAA